MHTLIRVFFHEGSGPAYGPDKRGVGSHVSYSGSPYPPRIRPPFKAHPWHPHVRSADFLIFHLSAIDTGSANPGTSEIHVVAALDPAVEMRCILGLFEGVVTAAADGYARMAEKPACTLLHLGPGLGNGLANLHNASRAQVPIINLVGQ